MDPVPSLIDFSSPPVVEVVSGIQFDPLVAFGAGHLGLFWSRVRRDFPNVRDQPPMPVITEVFGEQQAQSIAFNIGLAGVATPRLQLVDAKGEILIQVQPSRFLHNWQKVQGAEYRRYRELRPAFIERWQEFQRFVHEEHLGEIRLNQYELSYRNHIPEGDLWDDERRLEQVLPWFTPHNPNVAGGFEAEVALHSEVPKCRGRLHVTGRIGIRPSDKARVFQLELMVRGAPASQDSSDVAVWMDEARAVIVRSFVALTSDTARARWGQTK